MNNNRRGSARDKQAPAGMRKNIAYNINGLQCIFYWTTDRNDCPPGLPQPRVRRRANLTIKYAAHRLFHITRLVIQQHLWVSGHIPSGFMAGFSSNCLAQY